MRDEIEKKFNREKYKKKQITIKRMRITFYIKIKCQIIKLKIKFDKIRRMRLNVIKLTKTIFFLIFCKSSVFFNAKREGKKKHCRRFIV